MATTTSNTLMDAMRAVFPNGYMDHEAYSARVKLTGPLRQKAAIEPHTSFENPPCLAVDLFAVVGFLLLKSGGYHHVSPEVVGADSPRMLTITKTDRARWIRAGKAWRGDGKSLLPAPPKALTDAWQELLRFAKNPLYATRSPAAPPRAWWRAAVTLLAIADEAARDLGFETGTPKSAQAAASEVQMRQKIGRGVKIFTLSGADPDHVCVLPKSRTPKVGCTLRSLSHNLALLPARGLARAYWSPHPVLQEEEAVISPEAPFNLVIIPSPFRVRATAFKGTPSIEASWGWFHVDPHWCPASGSGSIATGFDDFWSFVESVLDGARDNVGPIHGLVFPEAALSYEVLQRLCEKLQDRDDFELLVAGLFDAPKDTNGGIREGNFAAMARRQRDANGSPTFDISTREKHHRWRVEESQIINYALGAALDTNRGWWERIDILSRSLDVFVLRGGATVTTLICEDLARNDPCQELVRGIGPNLVIALLMDGPQLKDRWPARYATVLAEDPGSSVLTVTSMGLIQRSNDTKRFSASDKIALWRDDTGNTVELSLAASAHGLCLTLQPSALRERTLDGRDDDTGAQSWRLTGIVPVTVADVNKQIVAGDWPNGIAPRLPPAVRRRLRARIRRAAAPSQAPPRNPTSS